MPDDPRTGRQIQVLRDLGLSRAESEVYLSCLALGAAGGGGLSSYRVAQDMGRDPANIGKIVNALVRLQAVRVVQEKPRLFVAVPPEEFTERLLGRLRRSGAEAVSLLESLGATPADGVAQGLGGRAQAMARIRELLGSCRHDLLVVGSPEALRELGADLERVAEQPGCRVRVVSPKAFTSSVVEIAVLPTAGRLGQNPGEDWVALAIDDHSWLVVMLPPEADDAVVPCGWWSSGSPVAKVLADCLETCWRYGMPVSAAADSPAAGQPVPVDPRPAGSPVTDPVSEPAAAATAASSFTAGLPGITIDRQETTAVPPAAMPPAAAAPTAAPAAAAVRVSPAPAAGGPEQSSTRTLSPEQAEKEGFTFLFRHDRKSDPGKR